MDNWNGHDLHSEYVQSRIKIILSKTQSNTFIIQYKGENTLSDFQINILNSIHDDLCELEKILVKNKVIQ